MFDSTCTLIGYALHTPKAPGSLDVKGNLYFAHLDRHGALLIGHGRQKILSATHRMQNQGTQFCVPISQTNWHNYGILSAFNPLYGQSRPTRISPNSNKFPFAISTGYSDLSAGAA